MESPQLGAMAQAFATLADTKPTALREAIDTVQCVIGTDREPAVADEMRRLLTEWGVTVGDVGAFVTAFFLLARNAAPH